MPTPEILMLFTKKAFTKKHGFQLPANLNLRLRNFSYFFLLDVLEAFALIMLAAVWEELFPLLVRDTLSTSPNNEFKSVNTTVCQICKFLVEKWPTCSQKLSTFTQSHFIAPVDQIIFTITSYTR